MNTFLASAFEHNHWGRSPGKSNSYTSLPASAEITPIHINKTPFNFIGLSATHSASPMFKKPKGPS